MFRALTAIAAVLVVALAAVSCSGDAAGPDDSALELRTAPVTVDVQGRSLSLEAHLWRDFMPVAPPDGQPLAAVLRVHASGGSPPAGLEAMAVWILHQDQIWMSEALDVMPPDSPAPPYYEAVARGGPKWGPDVRVDVIVRLRDAIGRTYLLRAPDQLIQRTD